MTFEKMSRILRIIAEYGYTSGWIRGTGGGEIGLEPMGQFSQPLHRELLRLGFVFVDYTYIYRPRTRNK